MDHTTVETKPPPLMEKRPANPFQPARHVSAVATSPSLRVCTHLQRLRLQQPPACSRP